MHQKKKKEAKNLDIKNSTSVGSGLNHHCMTCIESKNLSGKLFHAIRIGWAHWYLKSS